MDGWIDGWIDRWMDGMINDWMDEHCEGYLIYLLDERKKLVKQKFEQNRVLNKQNGGERIY